MNGMLGKDIEKRLRRLNILEPVRITKKKRKSDTFGIAHNLQIIGRLANVNKK